MKRPTATGCPSTKFWAFRVPILCVTTLSAGLSGCPTISIPWRQRSECLCPGAFGHLLYSGAAESYRTVYTERTAELIGRRYARDIELFGYRFDGAESDGGRSQWPYA